MLNPIRVVVPIDCHNASAWQTALAYAQKIGTQVQPKASEYIILTHTKAQLKQTSLANHIGTATTKSLLSNKRIHVHGVGDLRHATLKTIGSTVQQAVIIAYFAEERMMETIDGLVGAIGVVVVPDFSNDVDNWSARWNPHVHGQQAAAPVQLLSDPVVEKALQALSDRVNLSNAVMNARDKEHANETLRILRAKGHSLETNNIKSWAIKNGWQPKAATELTKLATKIEALKSNPSIRAFYDADGRYQRWHE